VALVSARRANCRQASRRRWRSSADGARDALPPQGHAGGRCSGRSPRQHPPRSAPFSREGGTHRIEAISPPAGRLAPTLGLLMTTLSFNFWCSVISAASIMLSCPRSSTASRS
jgi:hypothetical protein